MESPIVATYPLAGGRSGLTGAPSKGGKRAELPPTFIQGKCQKRPKRCSLRTLIVKGSGVIFMHGEGISTPHVRHKGRQPLIKCAISCLQFFLFFLFYVFVVFYWAFCIFFIFLGAFLYFFLSFCGRQWCFSRSYVSSIAMSKSDLRSSFRTKRWLSCFYIFSQDRF